MLLKGRNLYGRAEAFVLIDNDDRERYVKSLLAIRRRLELAFEVSADGSFREWVNRHGPILDDLLIELGYKGKL